MTQPHTVTTAELKQMQASINAGGLDAAEQVYATLYDQGYNYAGWASGVATGDTLSGQAALTFLQESAAESGIELTPAQIDKIRIDMAQRTLQEYIDIAKANDNKLTTDLDFEQTQKVHDDVFTDNSLSLDDWMLISMQN